MVTAAIRFGAFSRHFSGVLSAAGLAPVNHVRAFLKNGDNPAQARK
jgi:hypothetical protein